MVARSQPLRRDEQAAFVLHTFAYRETSLIVEAFTPNQGRVSLVARGAKRPRSETRGLLQAFQPLTLSWSGGGELKTLMKAEWRGGLPLPSGSALLCGFYLNELLMKLLAREDPHPSLFAEYESALESLATTSSAQTQAAILRRFEVRLVAELGYALTLTHEVDTGGAIDPGGSYHYVFDRGPRRVTGRVARETDPNGVLVRGATLLALSDLNFADAEIAVEAKRMMREILDRYLEERRIFSRRVVRDLMALDEEGTSS